MARGPRSRRQNRFTRVRSVEKSAQRGRAKSAISGKKETSAAMPKPADSAAKKNNGAGAAAPAKADQAPGAIHAYRTLDLRGAAEGRCRQDRAPVRLGAPRARPWRPAVHRPARPLWAHPMRGRSERPGLQGRRAGARGMGDPHRRQGGPARGRHGQPEPAHGRGRGANRLARRALEGRRAALARVRRAGLSRGHAAQIPLPRSAPRHDPPQHHEARRDCLVAQAAHERGRLLRVPNADPDRLIARRRARLPGAVADAPRQVLRAAAGAAAVQAAHHDRGLRPLFPDRAVLPRRGRARRPQPGRVLPARYRDELRDAGRRVPGGRAGAARAVRGVRRRQACDASNSRMSATTTPSRNTAPTSRTCATPSSCRM